MNQEKKTCAMCNGIIYNIKDIVKCKKCSKYLCTYCEIDGLCPECKKITCSVCNLKSRATEIFVCNKCFKYTCIGCELEKGICIKCKKK